VEDPEPEEETVNSGESNDKEEEENEEQEEQVPIGPMPAPVDAGDDDDDPGHNSSSSDSGSSQYSSSDESSSDGEDNDRERDTEYARDLEEEEEVVLTVAEDGTKYSGNLYRKFITLGLTAEASRILINNGVTTPTIFARLFDAKALDLLFQRDELKNLSVLAQQRVRTFHKWLRQCHDRGVHLNKINLSRFTDVVMASLLDAKETESSTRGRSGTVKESGLTLPTFSGTQASFKVFDTKFRAFLCQNKNEEGVPLIYVIARFKDESKTIQRQIKNVKLHGTQFSRDNFKVAQWLQTALAEGSASVYAEGHNAGDGRRAYRALYTAYQSRSKRDTRAQEIRNKLKTLQYRGTKGFPWETFTNRLLGYYEELRTLKQKVSRAQQVRDLVNMIVHEKTKGVAVNIITERKAKADLKYALAKIGRQMSYLGAVTASGEGGQNGPVNPARQIKRLKAKVKKLQKKNKGSDRTDGNHDDKPSGNYIPSDVIEAIKAKGGKKGKLYVHWLMTGRSANAESGSDRKRTVGAATRTQDDDDENDDDDDQDVDQDPPASASASFGRGAQNRHVNPPQKKKRKEGAMKIKCVRTIAASNTKIENPTDYSLRCRAEIDTRADTVCAGASFRLIDEDISRVADVGGFHPDMPEMKDIPIGTAVTAIDLAHTQETVILVFHEALYFGKRMEESLINPNQLRVNGLIVDTCPKQFSGGKSMHGIYVPDENLYLPFHLHGVISHLVTYLPTDEQLNNCRWIYMTSDAEWKPYSEIFSENEKAYQNVERGMTEGENFNVTGERVIASETTIVRRSSIDSTNLARRWGINQSLAAMTLQAMTTRAIRNYPEEEFSRRFRTRQAQLRFPHLRTKWYSDTLFFNRTSIRGYTCAQFFCNNESWNRIVPMRSKADAGDALNTVVRDVGIPEFGIHTDNAGEESGVDTEWERVRKHFLIPQTFVEPYSPWMNHAEHEIGLFKTHYRRIMNRNRCPERLWCFGATYTSDIRELIARPSLGDRSAVERMTGETPDGSEFLDFDFYGWAFIYDPNDQDDTTGLARRKLVRWLGRAKNIGQALCYYVLKSNGRWIARSTV
jgi:hypothetical protein